MHKKREQEKKQNYKNSPKIISKMAISTYILIISLNINEVDIQIKIYSVAT